MTTLIDTKTRPEETAEKAKVWRLKSYISPAMAVYIKKIMPDWVYQMLLARHLGNDLYLSGRTFDSENEALDFGSVGHQLFEGAIQSDPLAAGLSATDFYFIEAVPEDAP